MVEALKVDVPVLRYLQASELVTAEVALGNRRWLVFLLEDPVQASLLLPGEVRGQMRRLFLEEVQLARSQLDLVEWCLREGIAEGRSPLGGVIDSVDESSTRAIRTRVRRHARNGQLLIPAAPVGREIEVGPMPATLPRGPGITISAEVQSMERESALLRQVSVALAQLT